MARRARAGRPGQAADDLKTTVNPHARVNERLLDSDPLTRRTLG